MAIAEKDLMSGLELQRLGMFMEPEPGNALEIEGVLGGHFLSRGQERPQHQPELHGPPFPKLTCSILG